MGKPYSIDLRERGVCAVEQEGMSRCAEATRYGVAISTAIGWVSRLHEMGSVARGQIGGHKPRAIRDAEPRARLVPSLWTSSRGAL